MARRNGPLTWAVTIFLVLQLGSGSFFVQQEAMGDVVRIAGLLTLIPFAWQQKRARQRLDASDQDFQTRDLAVFKRFLLGYVLWALSSTLLHGEVGQFMIHIAGAIFLLVVVRVLALDGGAAVTRVLPLVLGCAVAVSLGMGLLDPSQGLAGGRLRGLFVNANLLGFYAVVAFVAGLLLVRTKFWALALCALSIWAIVWTGSRTSAIAALSAVLLLALFGHRRSRLMFWALVAVAALWLVGLVDQSASPLLRSLDTRDVSLEEAVRVASVSPLLGLGVGGELVEVASSPLRAFVQGGVVALSGVFIMYGVLLREAVRRRAVLVAFTVAAIISSFGEAWFLSALGGMMLLFVATWIAVSSRFENRPDGLPPDARLVPEPATREAQ